MNFHLHYSGTPGAINAYLLDDEDSTVATTSGLSSAREARKWARTTANGIKAERTPPPANYRRDDVFVSVSGKQGFTV